jgi:hypothetical protein
MKVNISKPVSWFGPYQLAEALFWWATCKDEFGFRSKPDWVHKAGEWLAYGSVDPEPEPGERYRLGGRDKKPTWLYKVLIWIHSKKKQKRSVKIDWWDDHSSLTTVIVPLLKHIKEHKQGAPGIDENDVPETVKPLDQFQQWDWVLDQMIYSFEQLSRDWESDYYSGTSDLWFERQENGTSLLVRGENDTSTVDYEGLKAENERIQQGLALFGKYYRNLWC